MGFYPYLPLVLLVATATLCAQLAGYALLALRRYGRSDQLIGFTAFAGGVTVWLVFACVELLSPTFRGTFLAYRLLHYGAIVAVLGFVAFALATARPTRWLNRRVFAALAVVPVAMALLVPTDPGGVLFVHPHLESLGAFTVLAHGYGPLYVAYLAWSYALIVGAAFSLARRTVRSPAVATAETGLLVAAVCAPIAVSAVQLLGLVSPPGTVATPLSVSVSALALGVAVFRDNPFDILSLARSQTLDRMTAGYLVLDDRGRVVDANPAGADLLDATPPVAREPLDALAPELADALADAPSDGREEGVEDGGEERITLSGDDPETSRHFSVAREPLSRNGRRVGTLLVLRDTTARERRERRLAELNTRLELALEETDTGVWEWDLRTEAVFWDETCERLFGYEPGSFPETYAAFADRVVDEDLADVTASVERAIESGEQYSADFRIRLPGGEHRWIQSRGFVEYEDGDPARLLGVQTDVTERVENERALDETNEKLQLLNQIVRHDIRNDMSLVLGYADHVAAALDDEAAASDLATMVRRGEHVVELTNTVRDLMETMLNGGDSTKPMSLGPALSAELDAVRAMAPEAVVRGPDETVSVRVRADEMLETVLHNVLTNAVRHNDTDRPEIAVSVAETDGTAVVRVADNGPGIPPENRDAVFGRGEKGLESPGSGIGLYLVHTILDGYGGGVAIEDSELGGVAFVLRFPTATDGEAADGDAAPSEG